ncbi:MAG: hypothetical protein LBB86_09465 [Oscillospiraceae bacterium]|jgi:hypothetical protein|nr:hypothetical protein [Oscillospiraceae bacterium]
MSMPHVTLPTGVLSGVDELTLNPSFIQLSYLLLDREASLNGLLAAERDKLLLASSGPTGPAHNPGAGDWPPTFGEGLELVDAAGDMISALGEMACAQSCMFWLIKCIEGELYGKQLSPTE